MKSRWNNNKDGIPVITTLRCTLILSLAIGIFSTVEVVSASSSVSDKRYENNTVSNELCRSKDEKVAFDGQKPYLMDTSLLLMGLEASIQSPIQKRRQKPSNETGLSTNATLTTQNCVQTYDYQSPNFSNLNKSKVESFDEVHGCNDNDKYHGMKENIVLDDNKQSDFSASHPMKESVKSNVDNDHEIGVGGIDGIEEGVIIDLHKNILGPQTTWPIQNDIFEGNICVLIRDHPHCDYNFDGEDNVFFEVQFQGKFKRQLKGPLYLSLEYPQTENVSVSWPLKTALNALTSFIKSWGYKYIHLSYGGNGETPHLSTPAFQALDRLVITKEGQTAPPLGYPIPESYDETVLRKKFQLQHKVDTSNIYTMSFNSTYMNSVDWKVYGIPIVKSIDLSFTDVLRLNIYEVVEENEKAVEPNTFGDTQSVVKGRHTKRNVATWIQLRRHKHIETK